MRRLLITGLVLWFVGAVPAAASEEPVEPGNTLLVVIPDPKPVEHKVVVDHRGTVVLGRYGRVEVGGRSVEEAEKAVRRHLGRYIVNTRAITLVRLADGLMVFVSGQVQKSGFVQVEPGEDLWQAIQRAGGPNASADLGRVLLARNGKEQVVDVNGWLAHTAGVKLPALQAGDTIFVAGKGVQMETQETRALFLGQKALKGKVFVLGAVTRPGVYDHGEGLTTLVALGLAGGPTNQAALASTRILTGSGSRNVDLARQLSGEAPDLLLEEPEGGMILYVPPFANGQSSRATNQISVIGGFTRPGHLTIEGSVPLTEAVALAGGPSASAEIDEIFLLKQGPGYSLATRYDLQELLEGGGMASLVRVEPGDTLYMDASDFEVWRTVVQTISDLAVISTAILLFLTLEQQVNNDSGSSNGTTSDALTPAVAR